MRKSQVHLFDVDAAKKHVMNTFATCKFCGKKIPYYPYDEVLRHSLVHAEGDERKRIEELIEAFKDEAFVAALAERALSSDPLKFADYGARHGFLHRVRGEE